jgi:hypothetical protein
MALPVFEKRFASDFTVLVVHQFNKWKSEQPYKAGEGKDRGRERKVVNSIPPRYLHIDDCIGW